MKMEEYKTYDMARFHIEEGAYSIEDLEEILRQCKELKKQQDEMLRMSMGVLKGE